jgi:opacity protein-like surface antigen
MKKIYLILLLTMVIMTVTAAAAWAGPIGINVKADSWKVTVKNNISPSSNNFDITCDHGFNDKFLLLLTYGTETQAVSLGGRYVLVNNLAGLFNYKTTSSTNTLTVGLGGKIDLSKELALVGVLNDLSTSTGKNTVELTGQAEYKLGSLFFVNGGLKCSSSQSKLTTNYLLGAEWYPGKNFTVGLDCSLPSTGTASTLTAVLKYAF